jgi:DHA1 family inner membrane transport protein
MAIAAGYGWTSTGWVGCALALGGLLVWFVSWRASAIGAGTPQSAAASEAVG